MGVQRLVALLTVLLVGGSATSTASPVQRGESLMAGCMKDQGFRYIPFAPPKQDEPRSPAQERESRSKYGFKVFSRYVYPYDRQADGIALPTGDPNDALTGALSLVQLRAYSRAYNACFAAEVKRVTGKQVSGFIDLELQREKAIEDAVAREFDGDVRASQSARQYAACLLAYGHTVRSVLPSKIAGQLRESFIAERNELARAEFPDREMKEGVEYLPTLSPAQARPYLEREKKAALDDLTCAATFFRRTGPIQAAIKERVAAEWAVD